MATFDREFTVILRLKKGKTQRWSLSFVQQYLGSHLDEMAVAAIYPGRLIPTEEEMARDYPPRRKPRRRGLRMITAESLERCGVPPAEAKRRARNA